MVSRDLVRMPQNLRGPARANYQSLWGADRCRMTVRPGVASGHSCCLSVLEVASLTDWRHGLCMIVSESLLKTMLETFGATEMDDTSQAFFFLLTIFCLGICLIAAFWEIEQAHERRRNRRADQLRAARLAPFRDPCLRANRRLDARSEWSRQTLPPMANRAVAARRAAPGLGKPHSLVCRREVRCDPRRGPHGCTRVSHASIPIG
jgi:hypothetical protein